MPVIVAEALKRADPLEALLRPARWGSTREAIAAIMAPLRRPRAPYTAPGWLHDFQADLVRQLVPPLLRHGGAMLAAPVGSGKTRMALASAGALGLKPLALVPAALESQWRETAARLGLPLDTWSHERVSRGSLPPALTRRGGRLVIIDESHHFRNPGTRRYRHLAPALIGFPVLLLTATPLVNRPPELAAQLLLGIRDDALAGLGIRSIEEHLTRGGGSSPALGTLIIAGGRRLAGLPRHRRQRLAAPEEPWVEALCDAIDGLRLSTSAPVAALIRGSLWRSLASSPAALAGALRRYENLLGHAAAARAAGRPLDRAALRSWLGDQPEQLVLWELVTGDAGPTDLVVEDREEVCRLIGRLRAMEGVRDPKLERLGQLLTPGRRTLVFTACRDTVHYLRRRLGRMTAWCTGDESGIGATRLDRSAVLEWFGPSPLPQPGAGPEVLVTTDVAAEGLDLQGAGRVIHYDLPWTAVRLDQRNGRALRLGSTHASVEVVRFDVPRELAHRLQQVQALGRKRRLPRAIGIQGAPIRAWEWRDRMAERWSTVAALPGVWARARGPTAGVLAGYSLVGNRGSCWSTLGWVDARGWCEDPAVIERVIAELESLQPEPGPAPQPALGLLGPVLQDRIASLERWRWAPPVPGTPASRLIARVNRCAVKAARERDAATLALLERALGFLRRGHTAGERHWIERWRDTPEARLLPALARCPDPGASEAWWLRINGVILVET